MHISLVISSILFSCLSLYFSAKIGMDDDTEEILFSLNSLAALMSAVAAAALGFKAIFMHC